MKPRVHRVLAILIVFALTLAVWPTAAVAQAELPAFKSLKVSIWPEYDEASVLVIWYGRLADGTALPVTVKYPVPADARISSACAIDSSGKHDPQTVERAKDDGGDVASINIDQLTTDIEFYYNPIEGGGVRDLSYVIKPLHTIESLEVEVQQPLRSTNFAVTPAANAVSSDQAGFQYHRYDFGRVEAGREISLDIDYEKTDATPSVTPGQQGGPAAQGTNASGGNDLVLPLLLLGSGGIVLVLYFSLRNTGGGRGKSRRNARVVATEKPAKQRKAAPPPARQSAVQPDRQAGARYCTACGAGLRADAAFCSACGQPVRGAGRLASP